jgi:hypothetical protein
MVAPVHDLDPTILPEESAKLRGGGGQSSIDFIYLWGAAKLRCAGGGGRSAPLGVAMSPKRRVRAAHGRAREAKTH